MNILSDLFGLSETAKSTKETKKRNITKEAQWQKEKYKKFGFSIDRMKGEKFVEVLKQIDKTPLEWFKEQVENYIMLDSENTTVVNDDTTVNTTVVNDDTTVLTTVVNNNTTVVNDDTTVNTTVVNDDTTVNIDSMQKLNIKGINTNINTIKKPPITLEIEQKWYESGLSSRAIAKDLSLGLGYSYSAINKHLKNFRQLVNK